MTALSLAPRAAGRALGRHALLEVARGLAATALDWCGVVADPHHRRWRLLATSEQFEAYVIGWPPGGAIALHDHGSSSGALVVAGGSLVETALRPVAGGPARTTRRALGPGDHVTFGPGHIHDVVNEGHRPAVSVHVYSPALETMTFYDAQPGWPVEAVRTERIWPVAAGAWAGR